VNDIQIKDRKLILELIKPNEKPSEMYVVYFKENEILIGTSKVNFNISPYKIFIGMRIPFIGSGNKLKTCFIKIRIICILYLRSRLVNRVNNNKMYNILKGHGFD